jgi:hypothetical protein
MTGGIPSSPTSTTSMRSSILIQIPFLQSTMQLNRPFGVVPSLLPICVIFFSVRIRFPS